MFLLTGVLSILIAQPASAAKFGVRVVDDSGLPVSGASVCVGLPGNYRQFGAMFTDADGQAMLDVPNVPLVVTVSKTRFAGIRLSEPARNFNLVKQVTLADGVPGPRCRAGSTLASPTIVTIERIAVTEGVYSTILLPTVSGSPSHYRVSRSDSFEGVRWQPYKQEIALSNDIAYEPQVYLQMRRLVGSKSGSIEALSNVVSVQLPSFQ